MDRKELCSKALYWSLVACYNISWKLLHTQREINIISSTYFGIRLFNWRVKRTRNEMFSNRTFKKKSGYQNLTNKEIHYAVELFDCLRFFILSSLFEKQYQSKNNRKKINLQIRYKVWNVSEPFDRNVYSYMVNESICMCHIFEDFIHINRRTRLE